MRQQKISNIVVRLLSGRTMLRYKNRTFLFNPPTLDLLSRAEFYWEDLFEEVKFCDWPTMDTINDISIELGLWSLKEQEQLDFAEKQIEETKRKMYVNYMADLDISRERFMLQKIQEQYYTLLNAKHAMDYVTVEGYADSAKNEYILRECVKFECGFEPTSKDWQNILNIVKNNELTSKEYRLVARSNLWQSYWYSGKEKIFQQPVYEFNYEQRNMCSVSRMYDNARQATDTPPDEVFADDDLFDGWMIYKRKKDETDSRKDKIDRLVDKHHRGASHVFVVADQNRTPEQISKMNRNPNNVKKMANIGK